MNQPAYLDLQALILEKIRAKGGWVNAHAHFDRAYTLSSANFVFTGATLQKKWDLVDSLKREATVGDIYDRMAYTTEQMLTQGVRAVGTFIDVDEVVKDKAIKAAQKLRDRYQKQMVFKFINQVIKGVVNPKARQWFDVAVQFVDIIGGLPSKDYGREEEHLDILFTTGRQMNKPVHVHVDQFNRPDERETELLLKKVYQHGMENRVAAIHGISLAAQPKDYRHGLYQKMKKAGLMMIACPTAWIDHRRSEQMTPSHNAITPVDELVPAGLTVALGTDNIIDVFKPFSDGDLWTELRFLLEACHFYEIDELVKMATDNGLKVLGI